MIEVIRDLISRYSRRGIFVDTNPLLLYFVGAFDPSFISRFKRTDIFSIEDFNTLVTLLENFDQIITTPNVLTEVSNFSNKIGEPMRTEYFKKFAQCITLTNERYLDSHMLAMTNEFIRFGLTDAGTVIVAKEEYLILTDDLRLSQYLQSTGVDVINFNHLRPLGWQ